ncbi:hypothetical protein C1Y63_06640 [Corynebacterium sp. 13CS0277]|uniref:PH domain-containing protein n=1 Tax=Corynebacterium sp. 13CS0277 TaxID=2071994 RepID=UPI000D03F852|nr:PH domain-containing protein [Corynebacterium sp. 13CS0277]PRQ11377.1 hypothetical protein C1Y63_06640 [Corynebacterium sp. 13CS0277]
MTAHSSPSGHGSSPARSSHSDSAPESVTAAAADAATGTAAAPAAEYRRVHRLSPIVRFWTVIVSLLLVAVVNFQSMVLGSIRRVNSAIGGDGAAVVREILIGCGGVAVITAVVWVLSSVWWRAYGYRLDGEELAVRHGVVGTHLRTARYSRIQAVDVVEDFWPRMMGLAAVRVETAGGRDSAVKVEYLRRADAVALRDEIMGIVHGVQQAGGVTQAPVGASPAPAVPDASGSPAVSAAPAVPTASAVPAVPGAGMAGGAGAPAVWGSDDALVVPGGAGEVLVPEVPLVRSLGAAVLHLGVLLSAAVTVAVHRFGAEATTLLPFVLGIVTFFGGVLNGSWRYQAVRHGRVLTVSYGLFDRRSQNIALDRIHGVELLQPVLWRPFGWCLVQVSVAGYGHDRDGGSTKILPVGSLAQGRELLLVLSPLVEEDAPLVEWAPAIPAVTPLADAATSLTDPAAADPTVSRWPGLRRWVSPPVARWWSPLDARVRAVMLLPGRAVLLRRGFFSRRVSVVAPAHIQELTWEAGPVDRMLGLASVRFDLVGGPVRMSAFNLSVADAGELLAMLRARTLPPPAGSRV